MVAGVQGQRVHCVERATGKRLWVFGTGRKVNSSPVIAGDKVLVGSDDGFLYTDRGRTQMRVIRRDVEAGQTLAVPQGGYTAYLQTRVGEPYPYLKRHNRDFFGEVTRELHKRCHGHKANSKPTTTGE